MKKMFIATVVFAGITMASFAQTAATADTKLAIPQSGQQTAANPAINRNPKQTNPEQKKTEKTTKTKTAKHNTAKTGHAKKGNSDMSHKDSKKKV